jgi:RNA-splicing ligase RtcB
MIELKGKYNTAKIFTNNAEPGSINQVQHLLEQDFLEGCKIRVMPDVHVGMYCTIGTAMTITDKVVPNHVGVDIGCGMETVLLKEKHLELHKLDKTIRDFIPSGFSIRRDPHHYADRIDLDKLRCIRHVDKKRALLSVGTLGGGNHFIEVGKGDEGRLYLVVHSGSRNIGKQICEYYQNLAADALGRRGKGSDRGMAYLQGDMLKDYLHDMSIIQEYASINRQAMVYEMEKRMKFKIVDQFTTIHNYIDLEYMILRKGAISAKAGERVLIPINMRDGSLICIGKGNEDWNYSAPHGAGRLMSRQVAKGKITLTEYKSTMEGIFSTSVSKATIDEAPFAYKPMEELIANMGDTVDIIERVKPIYNFKAS